MSMQESDVAKEHSCKALVLHCIDFRIQGFLNEYLQEQSPGAYDRIATAGGVKNLPLEQFEISVRLHSPKTILLFQHEDCGAYGGSKALGDSTAEQAFQKRELEKAAGELHEKFPERIIQKYFVQVSGEIKKV